jgi:hypothetical protein
VHVSATLEQLGFHVTRVQEDQWTVKPDLLYQAGLEHDVVLYTRTWGFADRPAGVQLFSQLDQAGVVTASYHLDLYVGLAREDGVHGDPFWSTEHVFTPDGDPATQEWMVRHGINHHWIRPGVYRPECVPGVVTPSFQHDVVFVGSSSYHPEWPYRKQLLQFLERTYRRRYRRYGGGSVVVRNEALNNLYASAKVVVGDSLCLGFNHPNYWSDRVYETVGRGGFLIHPFIPGLDDEFEDGKHLRFYEYGDFKGLKALVDWYVKHPDEGRAIAAAGQQHVRDNCTYHDRLTEALTIMGFE